MLNRMFQDLTADNAQFDVVPRDASINTIDYSLYVHYIERVTDECATISVRGSRSREREIQGVESISKYYDANEYRKVEYYLTIALSYIKRITRKPITRVNWQTD